MNAAGPLPLRVAPDWSTWGPRQPRPWSVRLAEDVMIVDPERGVLATLGPDGAVGLGPLLAARASIQFGGAVITLTTSARDTVAEAVTEARLLRLELAGALRADGLAAAGAGLHPWSEVPGPLTLAPLRPRPATEVAGILGRFDATCGLRVQVAVVGGEMALRALDGLRLHVPLILALAANSPFWRGRFTGLASTRTTLRDNGCFCGLPRSFGSYAAYVVAIDALLQAGAIPSAASVKWDVRLRPELGAVEVTMMDAQTRAADLTGLAALVQCLVRLYAEREGHGDEAIPELLLENRSAGRQKGMRAQLIDPAGHFIHPAPDELTMLVEACAPVARELGCSRELAGVRRNAADPGHARQRNIAAVAGLRGVVDELVREFADSPGAADVAPENLRAADFA